MPIILKYTVLLVLICRISCGKMIQKCFTLNKSIKDNGLVYFNWGSRPLEVQVDLHCPQGRIHFGQKIFSIPKDIQDACSSEQCFDIGRTLKTCECCEKPDYSKVCSYNDSSFDVHQKALCETRQNCSLSIDIMDLGEHCATEIEYSCHPGHCKSRWVEVNYECVAGNNINLLSLFLQ